MTIADYIATFLAQHVDTVFGVYGAANAYLFDAFNRRGAPRVVCTAGEQGAGFAAEGYAKARGGLGVAVATSGPGALNLATSVANCWYDSVPALFLCGQVSTRVMRRPYSSLRQRGFQECPTVEVFKPIAKHVEEVRTTHEVREALQSAVTIARQGRPGPVVLSIPLDIQPAPVPEWPSTLTDALGGPRDGVAPISVGVVQACLTALAMAERPVIIAGGGCVSTADSLRAFAERFEVPVFPTWNAIETAPDGWPFFGGRIGTYGGKGRNIALANADFALVIGSRLSGRLFGGRPDTFLRGARGNVWHVDVDKGVLDELEQDLSALERKRINAYAWRFFGVCSELNAVRRDTGWLARVRAWRDRYDPVELHAGTKPKEGLNPYTFIRALSRAAPANAIAICDCGGNAVIFQQAWEVKAGQRIFSSHGNSPMGGALGYGLGAAIAQPERPVIVVIGDGGFTLSAAELNTLRVQQRRLGNLCVFVLNNEIYGITRAWQRTNLEGRYFACGPEPGSGYQVPEIAAVCNAYGVECMPITFGDEENVRVMLEQALGGAGPLVVNAYCPGWDVYEPNVRGWDRPIEEMQPSLPAVEFRTAVERPVPGWKGRRG